MGKLIVTVEHVNVDPGGQTIVEHGESGEPEPPEIALDILRMVIARYRTLANKLKQT